MTLEILVLILVLLPLAWLVSEFQDRTLLRIFLGCVCLVAVGFCSHGLGRVLATFEANSYFAQSNKMLIDGIIFVLKDGREDQVLAELKSLNREYDPSYESRSELDMLVNTFVSNMEIETPASDSAP